MRDDVLKTILTFDGHFAIGDLVRKVQATSPHIGTATVYRQIPVFLESGILKESFLRQSGQPLYEISLDDHHDHLVCVDCGAVFEFHEKGIESAQETLTSKMNFVSTGHTHVLYARCKLLKSKAPREPLNTR